MQRIPGPALSPFVALMWAHDEPGASLAPAVPAGREAPDPSRPGAGGAVDAGRAPVVAEHVLPTGFTHMVFRRSAGEGVRVFDPRGSVAGSLLPSAVLGGPRTSFYLRHASAPVRSAGVLLRPGAVRALFGLPAHAVAQQHVALADLCGAQAAEWSEELLAIDCPAQRLARLELILLAYLGGRRQGDTVHPAVAQALRGLGNTARIGPFVQDMSHRHFIHLFRDAVGMAPKAFARIHRVRRALHASTLPGAVLAQVASAVGYADQSHFHHDVRAVAGVTPAAFVRLSPDGGSHLPVPSGQIFTRQAGGRA